MAQGQPAPAAGQTWDPSLLLGPGQLCASPGLSFFTCKWGQEEVYLGCERLGGPGTWRVQVAASVL